MITVIIPTLWLVPKLAQNLKELNSCKHVGEIILIDNTENAKKIELSKLTHILEGKNTYVNPAWNKGVRLAKYDKLLIINDDTWFDWNLIEDIEKYIKETIGMIGIGHHNYSLQKTTQIKLEEAESRPDAFACAFFIHKNSWFPIPEEMKIWCGDDWLFLTNKGVGKQNYKLINFKVEGSIATTEKKLRNQNNKFLQIITNDQNWMKQNVYNQSFDWSNVGIGISTFSGDSTSDKRTLITEKCIRSVLKAVGKNCVKVIVNDGSTNKKHINVLNKYRKDFHIIDSPQNRGIAATKNEAIKYMYDQGCDYMFLVDDDIELLRGFASHYINAINKTKIQHFCFSPSSEQEKYARNFSKNIKNINGTQIAFTENVFGMLLVLTRKMVKRIGYFKILPYKYGHEHTLYTQRAIKAGMTPQFVDVAGSEKYIKNISYLDEQLYQADHYKLENSNDVRKNWDFGKADESIFIPYKQHKKNNPKIAVIIHAYHLEILNELFHYISHITYKFDLYLNFAEITEENSEIISEIKKDLIVNNPNISFHFTTSDNRGQDLGGFLVSANLIRQLGLKYDYICKIHTKANDSASVHGVAPFGTQIGWRREFLETLLGDESRVKEIVDIFETRSDIGYISSHKFYCNRFHPQVNKENYDFFVEKMGLNKEHCWPNNTHFVAGTMFWMRGSILDFIASKNIALEEFEVGAFAADGLRSHAFERIFDATVRHLGYKSMMIRESFKYE